jgi:hypothetical protein
MNSEVIVAFISGILGPVILLIARELLQRKKDKGDKVIKETLKMSELVNLKIESIRELFEADRVWIAQFHNGGNFYPTGKSMAKFSFIYEVVSANASSIQSNFQSIPVNLFSKSINELLENEIINIPDVQDPTIATFGLKYVAENNNSKSCYLFSIKTINDKFVGVMGIDYVKEKVKLTGEDINNLSVHATSLGAALVNQ